MLAARARAVRADGLDGDAEDAGLLGAIARDDLADGAPGGPLRGLSVEYLKTKFLRAMDIDDSSDAKVSLFLFSGVYLLLFSSPLPSPLCPFSLSPLSRGLCVLVGV